MAQQTQLECCICMDSIVNTKTNCVTTECGHTFHTNCLMANVSHNGFGCPYCRQVMAEEPENNNDDESETLSEYDTIETEPELYNDYALTSMRWMFQREQEGEIQNDDNEVEEVETVEEVEENIVRPNISFIAEKLAQRGTTYEDLIQAYLSFADFEEYDGNIQNDFIKKETTIFKKIKNIITEYKREQTQHREIHQVGIQIQREYLPDLVYVPEHLSQQEMQQFSRPHNN
jgi:hypothetical protein